MERHAEVHEGLEGVVATATRLSRVDGAAGRLTLAGYPVEELAPRASCEEVLHLLWHDRLPDDGELARLSRDMAARRLFDGGDGDPQLYRLARAVEETALRLLREARPGRRIDTNVELYTALLLHGLGLPAELFTPVFAVGRAAGWTAHAMEQRAEGRLIRPASVYVGAGEREPFTPRAAAPCAADG